MLGPKHTTKHISAIDKNLPDGVDGMIFSRLFACNITANFQQIFQMEQKFYDFAEHHFCLRSSANKTLHIQPRYLVTNDDVTYSSSPRLPIRWLLIRLLSCLPVHGLESPLHLCIVQ